jgi:hypothetical protein
MDQQIGSEQLKHVVDFIQKLLDRWANYHNHKESMSYTGFALFTGAAGVILIAEKWPPTVWGKHQTLIAVFALTAFWVLMLT